MSEPGREFLDLLSARVALGAFWSVLAGVVALADAASDLTDEQLQAALVSLGRSSPRLADGEAVSAHGVVGDPPGVLRARSGAVLSPVAVRFSDRSCGSLVCPAPCVERTAGGGPGAGWPLVEVQPVPSVARQGAAEALAVSPVRELRECGQRPFSTAPESSISPPVPGGSWDIPPAPARSPFCLWCPC